MKTTKNILCVMSDVGGAHRSVAQNIGRALGKMNSGHEVAYEILDLFLMCGPFCNFWIKKYAHIIESIPWFYKEFYHFTDSKKRWDFMYRWFIYPFMIKNVKMIIMDRKPDIIISTFALTGRIVIDALIELGKYNEIPVLIDVVDLFTIHRSWAESRAWKTIVHTEEAALQVKSYGVPENAVDILGFCLGETVNEPEATRTKLDLNPGAFTVMIMHGGEGSSLTMKMVESISGIDDELQIIAVNGRNGEAAKAQHNPEKAKRVRLFGYAENVPELMNVSDLLITKAGPATLMEAFSLGLPVIITSWIPGQEEGNVAYIQEKKLGFVLNDPQQIRGKIIHLMQTRTELNSLRRNIRNEKIASGTSAVVSLIAEKIGLDRT